ncbi:hypothetical protein HDF16_006375 [Granulicella aggregans]|uniref:Uncharacterized protein n=1 Tax=Granulicella aggregans TaxID=474949 RepID=A0A7W8E7P9_9BACT|nr:hypothetical protein [Granulicella aggregans]
MTLASHENLIRRRIMAKMNQACNAVRDWRRLKKRVMLPLFCIERASVEILRITVVDVLGEGVRVNLMASHAARLKPRARFVRRTNPTDNRFPRLVAAGDGGKKKGVVHPSLEHLDVLR